MGHGDDDNKVLEDSVEPEETSEGWEIVTKQTANRIEFSMKTEEFLAESFKRGILLEALIAEVLLRHSDAGDLFETGVARAAYFSESGDVQSLISVLAEWCLALRRSRSSCEQNFQLTRPCLEGRINAYKLKRFDQYLRVGYGSAKTPIPDVKPAFSFHPGISYASNTLGAIMANIWPGRLCVFRGHKDLGYLKISSKTPVAIGNRSCFKLTNKPPLFALYLDDIINGDRSPPSPQAHVWISVSERVASTILEKLLKTTASEVADQHLLLPVTVGHIGVELGLLAMEDSLGERLGSTRGGPVKVFYDREYKNLTAMCSNQSGRSLKDSLHIELETLRARLANSSLELPFPDRCSQVRLQIGEGFKCFGVAGFPWSSDKELSAMGLHSNEAPDNSDSMILRENGDYCDSSDKKRALILTKDRNTGNLRDQRIAIDENVVRFKSALLLNVTYRVDFVTESTLRQFANNCFETYSENLRLRATRSVLKLLRDGGCKFEDMETDITVIAKDVFDHDRVRLQVRFPDLYHAKIGVASLKLSRSVSLENDADQVDEDLKTFSVTIHASLYRKVENKLRSKLEKLKRWNIVQDYKIGDSIIKLADDLTLGTDVTVRISEPHHLHRASEQLIDLLEPAKISIDREETSYLKSRTGQQFLEFLMDFTDTYVDIPNYQQGAACVYGIRQKREAAAKILKKQLLKDPKEFQWHRIDLGDPDFVSDSVKVWFDEFGSTTESLKRKNLVERYVLRKDRPELWLETTADSFRSYNNDVKSRLIDAGKDNKRTSEDVAGCLETCSVCFDSFYISDEKCNILSICGHAYCTKCLLQMVSTAVTERCFPIKCALENCGKVIPAVEFRSIVASYDGDEQRKLASFSLQDFVARNPSSLRMCQNTHCPGMGLYEASSQTMSCLWCRLAQWFCVFCGLKPHPGEACGASFDIHEWQQKDPVNRKNCPNCTITIEKLDGCNCVECAYCKSFMCWRCAKFHHTDSSVCHRHVGDCDQRRNRRRDY